MFFLRTHMMLLRCENAKRHVLVKNFPKQQLLLHEYPLEPKWYPETISIVKHKRTSTLNVHFFVLEPKEVWSISGEVCATHTWEVYMLFDTLPWSNKVWTRSFFTHQMNYRKFKNWTFNSWSSQEKWSCEVHNKKSNLYKSWITECKVSFTTGWKGVKLGKWSCHHKSLQILQSCAPRSWPELQKKSFWNLKLISNLIFLRSWGPTKVKQKPFSHARSKGSTPSVEVQQSIEVHIHRILTTD